MLTVDVDCLQDISDLAASIMEKVPPNYCGAADNEDTKSVARFLIKTFGELIEVDTE